VLPMSATCRWKDRTCPVFHAPRLVLPSVPEIRRPPHSCRPHHIYRAHEGPQLSFVARSSGVCLWRLLCRGACAAGKGEEGIREDGGAFEFVICDLRLGRRRFDCGMRIDVAAGGSYVLSFLPPVLCSLWLRGLPWCDSDGGGVCLLTSRAGVVRLAAWDD
jgi:hypothetical protein